jgi:fucose 4-O-acetylase-like acetyltransferase
LYPEVSFWTSSPTFFFLRLGILMASVPLAYALSRAWKGEALQQFGQASLFVYWIHVELVYGVLSAPIHRRLPLAVSIAAFVAFSLAMFGLVRIKMAVQGRPTKTPEIGSASLPAGGNVSSKSI